MVKRLILLIDGDKTSIKMTFPVLQGFLGCHPYRVELAESAKEAYEVIQDELDQNGQLPAMVIMDPTIKGHRKSDLFEELRAKFPSVPKIIYSRKWKQPEYKNYMESGEILCFLPQPWDGLYQAGLVRNHLGI